MRVLNSPAAVSLFRVKLHSGIASYTTELEARVLELHSAIWEGFADTKKTSQKTCHLPIMFNLCFEERHQHTPIDERFSVYFANIGHAYAIERKWGLLCEYYTSSK